MGCGPPPLALPSQPLVPPGPPCAPRARTELLRTELAASCIQSQCGRTEPPREPRHPAGTAGRGPQGLWVREEVVPGRCDPDAAHGSGHRPPLLLAWPELLLPRLLFPGHLRT